MENRKSDSIRFFVQMPDGKALPCRRFESKMQVKAIHDAILWYCKIPVTGQKLYYKGEHLQRWQTLEDYSIQNGDCLELKLGFDDTSELLQEIHQMSSNICRMCLGEFLYGDTLLNHLITIENLLAIETKEESENLMSSYSVPATWLCFTDIADYSKGFLERRNLSVLRTIFRIRPSFFEMANTLNIVLNNAKEEDKSIVDLLSTDIKDVFGRLLDEMENNLRLIPQTARIFETSELKLEPLHFDCFEFSGKVIALALMHEVQVGVAFHRLFLLPLAGEEISVKDLRDANPSFYNNKAKHRFHDDDEILDDFINSMSEQISFSEGFDSVFGKSIDKLLMYRGIDVEDLNLVLKGDLNLGFNSGERTHVNHDNNENTTLNTCQINRQRLNITKSKWRKDRKKPLGGGISGKVYKGYADGGFFFAVKEIRIENKGEIDKIKQEVKLLCQFSHPNIVKYYGTEEDESKVNIFLELVSTGSLRKVYKSFELEESQVSHYTKQILEGLKYLHERKVVHRDIKCANILVDEKGYVKITDFGLTKVTGLIALLKSRYGKIDWIAPEVMNRTKSMDLKLIFGALAAPSWRC
ncbi:hypothetical protein GH714_006207 [Hevea brasiliensis]|uniref:mitogen-activated protein kinase kinase kinase n=1 Tax=Hevea brasiliensis TaxID=3981 RepID=A0A6A6KZJ1_HEVBR|nr:hypothetical protein GH714_006207 [Hevea brasiliensis]